MKTMDSKNISIVLLNDSLEEVSDPMEAASLVLNDVSLPTDKDFGRRIHETLGEVDNLATMVKILFIASIIINAGMTLLMLSMK